MIEGLYDFATKWSEKGSVWLYSDPHFSDEEQIYLCPNKPTDEEQFKLINSKVGKYDTFVCLGDVGNIEYIRQIRGYKVLITGNHDNGTELYKREIKQTVFDSVKYTKQEAINIVKSKYPEWKIKDVTERYEFHYPFTAWVVTFDNCLFDEVYGGPLMISPKIILSHEPLDIDWAFNIHGHTHLLEYDRIGHKCVCSDVINYKPISLSDIIKSGRIGDVKSLHRTTIDKATERKMMRNENL